VDEGKKVAPKKDKRSGMLKAKTEDVKYKYALS